MVPLQQLEEPEEPEEDRPERESRSKRHRHRRNDAQVVVGSSLTIDEDETSDNVVVMGGSLTVLGQVYGDAAAVGGSVVIEGRTVWSKPSIGPWLEILTTLSAKISATKPMSAMPTPALRLNRRL